MELIDKFYQMLKMKTRDYFHDGSLIEFIVNFTNKIVCVKIIHNRDSEYPNQEYQYQSNIIFYEINNLQLNNNVSCFGIRDMISEFNAEIRDEKVLFTIIGIEGWILSFYANDFNYEEEFIKIIKY